MIVTVYEFIPSHILHSDYIPTNPLLFETVRRFQISLLLKVEISL